jgi:Family of unknown function (DUF6529)
MEQLVEDLTRGNVSQVKFVLTSVVAALAVYQLVLIAVGYGKLRTPLLGSRAASWTHRASGDAIVVLIVLVGLACLAYYGFDDDETLHVVAGTALAAVLAFKIAVIRWWHGLGRLLPYLGIAVFALLAVTWLTTVGGYQGED